MTIVLSVRSLRARFNTLVVNIYRIGIPNCSGNVVGDLMIKFKILCSLAVLWLAFKAGATAANDGTVITNCISFSEDAKAYAQKIEINNNFKNSSSNGNTNGSITGTIAQVLVTGFQMRPYQVGFYADNYCEQNKDKLINIE